MFNTYEKPNNLNNYSVYIPKNETNECQIYINKKWFTFGAINIDEDKEDEEKFAENKEINDKEYNLIKEIREVICNGRFL